MKKYIIAILLIIASIAFAQKTSKVIVSFNAGELSPLMDARIDQAKYSAGCRTMENYIPLIYGAAQRRPGTEYIAGCKSNSAKSRLVAFEHSVDDTYILEFANQVIRVFRDGGRVLDNVGTADLSSLNNLTAHWLLDDIVGTTVLDDDGATHNGTATVDIATITTTGKVDDCFDLDGQYAVEVTDADTLSFTDNSNDTAFSIACWGYVERQKGLQVLISKWRDGGAREYRLSLSADRKLQLHLADASSSLASDRVAQWFLNDNATSTAVDDNVNVVPHDGVASQNTDTANFSVTGKINAALDFQGTEYVSVTDDDALSFDDSGTNKFSISAWIYVITGTTQTILSKWDQTTSSEDMEWTFYLTDADKLTLQFTDISASAVITCRADDAVITGWHHVVATYDSAGGATAANGMTLYIDNVAVAVTRTNDASYEAMEAGGTAVLIGASTLTSGSIGNKFQDKLDNVILFSKELTVADVSGLYNSGNGIEVLSGQEVSATADDAISVGWHFFCSTYSAPADESTAAANIILYVDGASVNVTATENASYTAMQNGGEEVRIGSQRNSGDSANENFWDDKVDEVSIFSDVLTPTEVASLYSTTPLEITSPYLTADLFQLKVDQSADVMFIDHTDYEPRKLSRTEHTLWTLVASDIQTGPFRDENTTLSKTITPSGTTGSITLTAIGHTPFVTGTTAGHEPSGSVSTSKSQTGALYKIIHAVGTPSQSAELVSNSADATHTALAVPKGVTWDLTTNGTWGTAGDPATVVLERSYDSFTTKETIVTVTSAANRNIVTSGTEDFADATYRVRVSDVGGNANVCSIQLSVRDTSHIGIVEITSVTSPTVAIGTVLKTLGSTDLTHRWSEGSFSNLRGWPVPTRVN